MKGVQCYELFGGIALKNHEFLLLFYIYIFQGNGAQRILIGNDFIPIQCYMKQNKLMCYYQADSGLK